MLRFQFRTSSFGRDFAGQVPCRHCGSAARRRAGGGRRSPASPASPYAPPMPWPAPGTTSRSKSLPALISASARRSVDSGGTFVSSSPTISSSLPRSRWALSMFEHSAYCGPTGIAHPLLVPRRLVHAVVVAAAAGDGRPCRTPDGRAPRRRRSARRPSRRRCRRG